MTDIDALIEAMSKGIKPKDQWRPGVTTESLLSMPIKWVVGEANYFPGMGLIMGFLLLFPLHVLLGVALGWLTGRPSRRV